MIFGSLILTHSTYADTVNQLRDKIDETENQIEAINEDIEQYQNELIEIGKEKHTLENEITSLDVSRKKIEADIDVTEYKIDQTEFTIEKLSLEIQEKEEGIKLTTQTIGKTIRSINQAESQSLVEIVLGHEQLSEFWSSVDTLERFQVELSTELKDLQERKRDLEGTRQEHVGEQQELSELQYDLSGRREVLVANTEEKNDLLDVTKNEEANYQTLLAQRQAEKDRFERELRSLESELEFALDPSKIPEAGKGVFTWPLDNVYITQYFGNTQFAQSGGYNGQGHNGVDFRAAPGTLVRAALSGEVIATNNQVAYMCQYGKWVLIRHANGLTTLYAHLSVVPEDIRKGARVSTGDIIGYSGETGYALGPHLHFTVYASDAVQFTQYTCNSGATLTIPVAAYSGYLNPFSYLPSI